MTRCELPSGAYAEMRDPGALKAKHRKQVMRAIKTGDRLGGELIDSLDGIIAVLVVEWDACDAETGERLPLPSVDLDSLDEIADADYEALCGAPEVKDLAQRIMKVRTGASLADDPDGYDDPASPTGPSVASTPASTEGSRKQATRSPKSTRSSKPSGSRTATAGTKTRSAS
jgi:hypothetical protein